MALMSFLFLRLHNGVFKDLEYRADTSPKEMQEKTGLPVKGKIPSLDSLAPFFKIGGVINHISVDYYRNYPQGNTALYPVSSGFHLNYVSGSAHIMGSFDKNKLAQLMTELHMIDQKVMAKLVSDMKKLNSEALAFSHLLRGTREYSKEYGRLYDSLFTIGIDAKKVLTQKYFR